MVGSPFAFAFAAAEVTASVFVVALTALCIAVSWFLAPHIKQLWMVHFGSCFNDDGASFQTVLAYVLLPVDSMGVGPVRRREGMVIVTSG